MAREKLYLVKICYQHFSKLLCGQYLSVLRKPCLELPNLMYIIFFNPTITFKQQLLSPTYDTCHTDNFME